MDNKTQGSWLNFINSGDPNDPENWLYKSSSYHSAVLLIIDQFTKIKDGSPLNNHALNAINTLPYLTCVSAELMMKGCLVSRGVDYKVVRKYKHELGKLREACVFYDKELFSLAKIVFLCDKLSEPIFAGGGIRYPDKIDVPVYIDDFRDVLDLLHEALKESIRRVKPRRSNKRGSYADTSFS